MPGDDRVESSTHSIQPYTCLSAVSPAVSGRVRADLDCETPRCPHTGIPLPFSHWSQAGCCDALWLAKERSFASRRSAYPSLRCPISSLSSRLLPQAALPGVSVRDSRPPRPSRTSPRRRGWFLAAPILQADVPMSMTTAPWPPATLPLCLPSVFFLRCHEVPCDISSQSGRCRWRVPGFLCPPQYTCPGTSADTAQR